MIPLPGTHTAPVLLARGLLFWVGLCGHDAALDDELVLVVGTVGIHEGLLVVLVEELLIGQRGDLLVDPVQQVVLPLLTAGAMVSALPSEGMPTV